MKTSNIVLTATGVLIFATLIFANMALKAELEKGDYKNRFYNLETMPVTDAKNISISVPGYLRVCVETTGNSAIKYPDSWDEYIQVTAQGDSLKLQVEEDVPYRGDTLFVLLKDLSSISMIDRGRLTINRVRQAHLQVRAGRNSDITFENVVIDSLEVTGRNHSVVSTKEGNRIGFLNLVLEDEAAFKAGDLELSGVKTQIGPQSSIEVTGSSIGSFRRHFQDPPVSIP